jgi:hypothetical protein
MWILEDNTIIKTPVQVTIAGETYPRLIFTEPETLDSLGIKEYIEVTPDNRYYWNGEFTLDRTVTPVVGTYASIDRDVDTLKENMLDTINSQVSSIQGSIDWYWARADKGGTAVPADISTYATTIYSEQATKESEVAALTDLAGIIEYENKPHTEVRKVKHSAEDGTETYGPETDTFNREINMLMHWTANPTDEVDPAFVSLTAD